MSLSIKQSEEAKHCIGCNTIITPRTVYAAGTQKIGDREEPCICSDCIDNATHLLYKLRSDAMVNQIIS